MRKLLLVLAGVLVGASLCASRAEAGVVDCEDFSSIDDAYEFFYDHGGPDNDPYDLDGDGDGLVCELGVGESAPYQSEPDIYVPEEKEIPSFSEVQECELMGKEYNGGNSCSDGFTGEDLMNWIGGGIILLVGLTVVASPFLAYGKYKEWRNSD